MVINKMKLGLAAITIILLAAAVTASQSFRFTPTHSISKESYCYNCHGQELIDVSKGTHIPSMPLDYQVRFLDDYYSNYFADFKAAGKSEQQFIDSFCQSCHMNNMQFYRFGLTDPYIFNNSEGFNFIYGNIEILNSTNLSTSNDQVVWADLILRDINPENATIHVTMSILLEDFSHQQTNTSFTNSGIIGRGNQLILNTSNIYPDYFTIIIMIDSIGWDSAGFDIGLSGTSDDGYMSFVLNRSGNYFLPYDISGNPYFHTRDYYSSVRLDTAYSEFRSSSVNNISALEGINTTTRTGATENGATCLSQDAMCHIVQKTAALGSTAGFKGPDRTEGFYRHDMPYTTSAGACLLCHLNGL